MSRRTVSLLFLCFFGLASCLSLSLADRREGLVDQSFRVYVRIDGLDIEETMSDKDLDLLLIKQSRERFIQLWSGIYIDKAVEPQKRLMTAIMDSSAKARIVYRKEREEYAEAYCDFPLAPPLKEHYLSLYPKPVPNDED